MAENRRKIQPVIYQYEHLHAVNQWDKTNQIIFENDPDREKNMLSRSVIEFFRWYNYHLEEVEKLKESLQDGSSGRTDKLDN